MNPPRHVRCPGVARTRAAPAPATGFTLVEVLIALAIFMGVVGAIYACWSSVLRSTRTGLGAAAEAQSKRMAVRCLEDALLSVQLYQRNARYYSFLADFESEEPSLSLVAHLPGSFPRSGSFEGLPVRRVTFSLERDTGGGRALVLRQIPVLFESDAEQEQNPLVLAHNVEVFTVEFWGPYSREWETDWPNTNQLPRLVRFSLGFGTPGGRLRDEDVVTRVVALPTAGVPAALQGGGPGGASQSSFPPPQGPGPVMGPVPGQNVVPVVPPTSSRRVNPPRTR